MQRLIFIFLLIAACGVPSGDLLARLGDTEQRVTARYGKPIEMWHGLTERHRRRVYHFKSFVVLVEFLDGRSQSETYTSAHDRGLSRAEIKMFLRMNSGGKRWRNGRENHWIFNYPKNEITGQVFLASYQSRESLHTLQIVTENYLIFYMGELARAFHLDQNKSPDATQQKSKK